MISQNQRGMRHLISLHACYMFSLVWWAHRKTGLVVSPMLLNDELYVDFQKKGYMRETCYVLNPIGILSFLGVSDVHSVAKRPASYKPKAHEFCIGQFKAGDEMSHFVPVDNKGNVLYDPWWSEEGGSRAVREGKLISWRVFT